MKIIKNIDRLGLIGLFITAVFSPCCFPLFAVLASAFGMEGLELFGNYTMIIFQIMILVSFVGLLISYRKHKCLYPILVALPSVLIILYGYHIDESDNWDYYLYAGMLGLLVATFWNYKRSKMHNGCCNIAESNTGNVELKSEITCPNCGHKKTEEMPTNACVYFYTCENCNKELKPYKGDCCVYCSYGSVKCPPIQKGESCC